MSTQNCCTAILLSILSITVNARQQLHPGDRVPSIKLENVYNNGSASIDLDKLSDKLVILDFWATWCTSCIRHFSLYDSLQAVYKDSVKLVLVDSRGTGDDTRKIQNFYARWAQLRGHELGLPSVMEDTVADGLFPHESLPHCVWLFRGKVVAVTSADEVSAANISLVLQGKEIKEGRPINSQMLFFSSLESYKAGIQPSLSEDRPAKGMVSSISLTNTSILRLCFYGLHTWLPANRVFGFRQQVENDDVHWQEANTYCYTQTGPPTHESLFRQRVMDDIGRYFGLQAKLTDSLVDCWALVQGGVIDSLYATGNSQDNNFFEPPGTVKYLHNGYISQLADYLNDNLPLPVVDDTHIVSRVSLSFELNHLNELERYGLLLRPAKRRMQVIVISSVQH